MSKTNLNVTKLQKELQVAFLWTGSGPKTRSSTLWTSESLRTFRTSSVTPSYFTIVGKQLIRPLPFRFEMDRQISRSGWSSTLSLSKTGSNSTSIGPITSTPDIAMAYQPDTTAPADLDSQCRNALLQDIKGMKIDLMQVYAERNLTAHLVGDIATKVAGAISHLRKGDIVGAANAIGVKAGKRASSRFRKSFARDQSQAVANGWLSLQYGWKPLLSDVYGACETLARVNATSEYVSTKKSKTRVTPLRLFTTSKSGVSLVTTRCESGERRTTVKCGVTYYRPSGSVADLASLGITNPLLLAWELMPYSFVVDWFLPIGSWLDTLDATWGLTFHSGFSTLFSKSSAESIVSNYGVNSSNQMVNSSTTGRYEGVRCIRSALVSFPFSGVPRFKNPVSLTHMANGLALLSQLLRK